MFHLCLFVAGTRHLSQPCILSFAFSVVRRRLNVIDVVVRAFLLSPSSLCHPWHNLKTDSDELNWEMADRYVTGNQDLPFESSLCAKHDLTNSLTAVSIQFPMPVGNAGFPTPPPRTRATSALMSAPPATKFTSAPLICRCQSMPPPRVPTRGTTRRRCGASRAQKNTRRRDSTTP